MSEWVRCNESDAPMPSSGQIVWVYHPRTGVERVRLPKEYDPYAFRIAATHWQPCLTPSAPKESKP